MEEQVWTKKKIILISIFGALALIVLIIRFFGIGKDETKIEIVTSTSKFYTVNNCVYRYLVYLQAEDTDSLMLLLDSSYKKKNNISSDNVLDKLEKLDDVYNFEARKMYQEELNENLTKYYVYGYLKKEVINQSIETEPIDYYVIVILNTKNQTFSITPYDGEIFIDGGI